MGISILYTYKCVYNIKSISINEKKRNMSANKEYTSGHKWERKKYGCQMHSTYAYYC